MLDAANQQNFSGLWKKLEKKQTKDQNDYSKKKRTHL